MLPYRLGAAAAHHLIDQALHAGVMRPFPVDAITGGTPVKVRVLPTDSGRKLGRYRARLDRLELHVAA